MACSIFVGGPSYPAPVAVPSGTQVQDLQGQIEQAVADSTQTGTLTVTLTESQLTGYLASALGAESQPIISDPQVQLRDGLMVVYGKVQSGIFVATAKITTQVTVDPNGEPQIDITQADFGPVPAPESLRTAVSAFLRETFTGSVGPAAIGFRLETINISDGTMTVTGRVR